MGVWGRRFMHYMLLAVAALEEILELMACTYPRKWTSGKGCYVQNGMKCTEFCKIMVSVTDIGSDNCDNLYETIFNDGCKSNIASDSKSYED